MSFPLGGAVVSTRWYRSDISPERSEPRMRSQEGWAVAMAPSPSYLPTALPKSVNSRATHDGEGAVATANPQMQSEIANRKIVNSQPPARPLPSTSLHFYTAKAISHDGEDAVATYGRSQQVRPSRVDLRSQWTATLPWRWRPRHRICQPPSRNQSISAQRTTTGASSLRQIPKCNRKSQIPNYQLSAAIYISPLLHG